MMDELGQVNGDNMEDHLRRIEMHMDMMQRMAMDPGDEGFDDDMFGAPYGMMFGGGRRREEEAKVDLLGI